MKAATADRSSPHIGLRDECSAAAGFFRTRQRPLSWTEVCLAMTAVQALADGYDVFIVTDASGGASVEAHDMAVRRMQAAGAVPITWLAVAAEWQRDWAREKTVGGFADVITEHGGASSVAYAWEVQLLARGAKAGA